MSQDESWIAELSAQLTIAEKTAMTAGADAWHSTGVPRLHIPSFKMSDGPNGVRGDGATRGATSLNFPVGAALGATWSVDLLLAIGDALGHEANDKDVQVLLGPTINIQRIPVAGRNFECYSEDPLLTSELAIAFVKGVQGRSVAACVKHFVANDSERERMKVSSEVGERALREIYLRPFAAVVMRASAWAVMSAYNRVNGEYASESKHLLTDVLKREWGFDGVVISDWFGTYSSPAPAIAGLDIEMPGPARFMGTRLVQSVQDGSLPIAVVDDKVRRLLRLMSRSKCLPARAPLPEQSVDRAEHRALARRAVHESAVLLKNDGALPLQAVTKIALIGPSAVQPQYQGGGSSAVRAHYLVSPHDGLAAVYGADNVTLARGCDNARYVALPPPGWLRAAPDADAAGWSATFHAGFEFAGPVLHETKIRRSEILWFGPPAPNLTGRFSAHLRSELRVPDGGEHRFSLVNAGKARLFVDDVLLVDNWDNVVPGDAFMANGSTQALGAMTLVADRPYALRVEYSSEGGLMLAAVRIGIAPADPEGEFAAAVALAQAADAAVVCVGLTADWESEGFDRASLALPGQQVELIRAVAAVNARTVVVINAGSPVALGDWLDDVSAVLQVWYPGQEFGNGLADILCGAVSPSGRLAVTLPQDLESAPGMAGYPGAAGRLRYEDDMAVGYRGYDRMQRTPQFPFGHGLTYGQFEYRTLVVARSRVAAGEDVEVALTLHNTGTMAAQEVVQLYVSGVASRFDRVPQELKAFTKVALAAGEAKHVRLRMRAADLAVYDTATSTWVTEPGQYRLSIGASSRDERLSTVIEVVAAP